MASTVSSYGSGGPESSFTAHKVVPDTVPSAPPQYAHVVFNNGKSARNGEPLLVAETQTLPQISFPSEPHAFYTVMMIDPDAPSNSDPKWRHYLHYLNVNVPGAVTAHSAHTTGGATANTGGGLLSALSGTSSTGTSASMSSSSQAAAGSSPAAPISTHATSATTSVGSQFASGTGPTVVTGTTGTLDSGTAGTHATGAGITTTSVGVTSSHQHPARLGHHNPAGSGPHGEAGHGSFADLSRGNTLTSYAGPAPPEHTGYHRYIMLVYKQQAHLDTSIFSWEWTRASWNLNEWLRKTFGDKQPQLHAGNFFTAQNEKQGGKPSY